MTVMAFDTSVLTNADLIQGARELGYVHGRVLDPTYGYGGMWLTPLPLGIVRSDLEPKVKGCIRADFRDLPFFAESFNSIVFDPPYRLAGTATSAHQGGMDDRYGIGGYMSVAERHAMIADGIVECVRVLDRGGHLLVKCQDQVCSGRVHWQTRIFSAVMEGCGLRLVDMMHLPSYRAQPAGRRQVHARRNYSTLLVGQR